VDLTGDEAARSGLGLPVDVPGERTFCNPIQEDQPPGGGNGQNVLSRRSIPRGAFECPIPRRNKASECLWAVRKTGLIYL